MVTSQTFHTYTRSGGPDLESPFEKPVVVPAEGDDTLAHHAWADARFATDIMSEHAFFFALLMPVELAAVQREEALRFHREFGALHDRIVGSGPPAPGDTAAFCAEVVEAIKPFAEYKATLGVAQRDGTLRSLVWPLFFDHTRHEAERWSRRLEQVGSGYSEFDRREVVPFWSEIMDEHCRFVAHLLDPDEFKLIEQAMAASAVFETFTGGAGDAARALVTEPAAVTKALVHHPELDAVLSAARELLDFKTSAARDIEAGRIMSIIDPRLADHVRREALKFVDELKRSA
ncbi:MAG TPA: DUF2935 domain-containing protein [Frankiaceae bacterium]|nr:DUF2935 domain-containing protein [Frankiaceae bacterium]